ncbi:DUF1559 domain-containing protein [Lacipirellula parvula]|uniref:DUF1559 domain-containing protein n=1 Tax=Lacipirellula parvula TaxID=2650471 RepID=A0A5K7XJK5_9BACT|nr:DUF1559 domain-containing protein [Lacipirellula parvula]BBO36292.1 hypothetical protein PLANPX_5904 [Lacipirellula parvula]
MTEDLIAYLMDDLSPERRAEVEAKLETDVVWRWELQRLRECMTAADGDASSCDDAAPAPAASAATALATIDDSSIHDSKVDVEPPLDLVKKTCCFVEDSASGKFKVEKKRCSKKQAAFTAETVGACKRSWSLADVTVASGVGLILAALILPAVQNGRAAARNDQCANNMGSLGMAIENYAGRHAGLMPAVNRNEPSIAFFTRLVDDGDLTPQQAFQLSACPDSVQAQERFADGALSRLPSTMELSSVTGLQLLKLIALANVSYAAPVGYFNAEGEIQPLKFNPGAEAPLMTDAPTIGPTALRSNSHGGCRQNVLSSAGCVRPYTLCVLSQEDERMRDIHLNDAGLPAAGNSPDDIFLAPPNFGPDGPVGVGNATKIQFEIIFCPVMSR